MSKEWWEKEVAFQLAYERGTTAKDLWRYIPQRLMAAVDACFTDLDGYWVYLAPGWAAYDHDSDCGVIREYTIRDLLDAIKTIAKR